MALDNEHLLTPAEATREFPGRPALRTIWRWMQRGVRGVKLESITIGGRRFTSREAGQRFIEATTAAAATDRPKGQFTRERAEALDRAERELDESGI